MLFEFETLPIYSATPSSFTKKFHFKPGSDERDQVVQAIKRARENQCRIYVLKDEDVSCGFVAVSLSTVGDEDLPMLVLDYLLVSFPYRGQIC